ncbi:hypothetical protein HOA92_06335 [archaeon]|jgi:hypothetical protein|nr:hypothetical protein [archaeon]MBT6762629.1 hypothetical protein [archaeon]
MTVKLNLYDQARLVSEVKPGQVLEAMPGSLATRVTWGSDPSQKNPSGVLGYVRGDLRVMTGTLEQGSTVVSRLLPFGEGYLEQRVFRELDLTCWSFENPVYLAIGELANVEHFIDVGCVTTDDVDLLDADKISEVMRSGYISLPDIQVDILRDQMLDYVKMQARKDYEFVTPSGESFSLSQILASLRERS